MLQSTSSVFIVYRRKTLTGSPDPTHANGTNKPCIPLRSEDINIDWNCSHRECRDTTIFNKNSTTCHVVRYSILSKTPYCISYAKKTMEESFRKHKTKYQAQQAVLMEETQRELKAM